MSLNKQRLDKEMVRRGLVVTRSQAESYIKLDKALVNGRPANKPAQMVSPSDEISLAQAEQYVSRAGLKLASVAQGLGLDFNGKVVLDVGSSTGGFTDFALKHDAKKVIAVDVGTDQMHPSLRTNPKIELHEKTDVRDLVVNEAPDMVVIDVSFISLREILPSVARLSKATTQIVAMFKPQFEAEPKMVNKKKKKNKKNHHQILKDFEIWAKKLFIINDKADSHVAGAKGNLERFYLLKIRQRVEKTGVN